MKNLQQKMNKQAWENIQDEIRTARQMFNYATEKDYIDIAIELERLALAKKKQLEKIMLQNRSAYTTEVYKPKEQGLKRFYTWLVRPYKELYEELKKEKEEKIDLKPVQEYDWCEIGNNLGFNFKPIDEYKVGGTDNDIQKKV